MTAIADTAGSRTGIPVPAHDACRATEPPRFGSWESAVVWLRNQPDQAALVRGCYYDDPLLAAAQRYASEPEWREIADHFLPRRPGRALDVGAGRGIATYALAECGWQVTALEPDPSSIVGAGAIRSIATLTGLPITVTEEFAERLPFADAAFDLVFCRQALHHARDLQAFCRELGRVLRPGGTLIAVREHVVSRRRDVPQFQARHQLHRLYGGENAFRLTRYLRALRQGGIRLERVLNPLASAINLYPESLDGIRRHLASRLPGLPSLLLPDGVCRLLGWFSRTPGRLFSFIGTRV